MWKLVTASFSGKESWGERVAQRLFVQASSVRFGSGSEAGSRRCYNHWIFGFLVGPPLFGALASFLGLPAALSLVIAFGLIIANSARRAVADPPRSPPNGWLQQPDRMRHRNSERAYYRRKRLTLQKVSRPRLREHVILLDDARIQRFS